MPNPLNALESAVLRFALDGDSPILSALRAQAAVATLGARDLTGVGFFSALCLPTGTRSAGAYSFQISDVVAEIPGLNHGAGFVLFIEDGCLKTLEGFVYDEAWPEADVKSFTLSYLREPRPLV